jgi:hypothetical protein
MNRELIMLTLFAKLTAPPLVFNFQANLQAGNAVMTSVVGDLTKLVVGMPLDGQGVADGATLVTITPPITMSLPATQNVNGATLIQGFKTTGRRLMLPAEATDQPAMFLVDGDNHYPAHPSNVPGKAVLMPEVIVYAKSDNPDISPSQLLNPMIDAIESILTPPANSHFGISSTLGLLGVVYCRIEGNIEIAPGYIGGQSIAIIPLKIEVSTVHPTAIVT